MLQSAAFRMLTQSFAINAPILNYHVQYTTTNQSWECYPPYNWYKGVVTGVCFTTNFLVFLRSTNNFSKIDPNISFQHSKQRLWCEN